MTPAHPCVVVSLSAAVPQAPPAESAGTPEARAAFEAGRAADREGDTATAVALFRKAIDLDPRYVEAHDEFISTTEKAAFAYDAEKRAGNEAAQKQATASSRRCTRDGRRRIPDIAVYEWALSKLAGKDWNAAERHLTRAIAISPAFARPYQDLSLIAELRGDNARRHRVPEEGRRSESDRRVVLLLLRERDEVRGPRRVREAAAGGGDEVSRRPSAARRDCIGRRTRRRTSPASSRFTNG